MRIADQVRMSRVGVPVPDPLMIFGTPITTATEGIPYATFAVTSTGGTGAKTYSLAPGSGAFPAGITIDPLSGIVAGTPSADGSFTGIVIRVTDAALVVADLAAFDITVNAAGAVAVLFGNSSQVDAGGALTATASVEVLAASNQVLIASVFVGGLTSDDITSVTATGYTGTPTAMTKLCGAKGNLGSRNHNCEIWALENPPLGMNAITATRSGVGGAQRFYVVPLVAYDVSLGASPVDVSQIFTNAPGVASYSSPITLTDTDLMVVTAFSGYQTTGGDISSPLAGQTAVQNVDPADYYGGVSYKQATSTGAFQMGATTNNSNWRSAIVCSISLKATAHVALAPIFYADPAGDDADDGLTTGTAVRTLERLEKLPRQPGKRIRVNGFIRNDNPPSAPLTEYAFRLNENGTLAEPVIIEPWGSDPPAMLGDVLYPTGWTGATLAETNSFFASIEKRDMGTALEWGMAPCCGGAMLAPAQWAKNVNAAGPRWWNDTAEGSQAYYHYSAAEYGGSTDPSKMVSYTIDGGGLYTIKITDPSIGTRYGTNTPLARGLCFRGAGSNTAECAPITGYDQATGTIYCQTDHFPPQLGGYWAVRFHPRDLVMSEQYAYSQDLQTVFAAFPSAAERSVLRYNFGVAMIGDYLQNNGVGVGRACSKPGLSQFLAYCSGENGKMDGVTVAQGGIAGSPDAINVFDTSDTWEFLGIRIWDIWGTAGGFRIFGNNILLDDIYIRDAGGTYIYAGGTATNVIARNLDCCEQLGVHGNAMTSYQGTSFITYTKFAAMNSISPLTAQLKPDTLRVKSNVYSYGMITGARNLLSGAFDNAYGMRLDGGDYGSLVDRTLTVNCPSSNPIADNPSPNNASNNGMVVRRSVMATIGLTSSGTPTFYSPAQGVLLEDLLTISAGGSVLAPGVGGATTPPARCSQIIETFPGALTDAMWEMLTRNAGGVAGYSAFQIGPDAWGCLIPAYGGSRTMVPLGVTTTEVWSGLQQNKVFASVYGAMPGSTLTLPSGVGDNNDFAIDAGTLRHTAGALTTNKTITVRETNAAATNGPTRDTVLTITMRDPFATFG